MVLRRQQSNCSTPPHSVPWGQKHIVWSVNSVKERYFRPCLHEEDQRSDINTPALAVLESKVQAPRCRRTSPILTFLSQQKDWAILRKMEITKCWHEPGTGGGGVKNHLYPHLSHFSSQFPTSSFPSLPISPPLQQNPFTFLSFFTTSPFLPLISYPLAPSHSLKILVSMFNNSWSENISRILDRWTQKYAKTIKEKS